MRILPFTPLLAVIVSASLLYHHTDALGTDSASHGLLHDGRVVRRYGNFGSDSLFNKRYSVRSRGFQERAEEPKGGDDPAKDAKVPKDSKEPKEKDPKEKNPKEKDEPKKENAKEPSAPSNDPAKDPTDTDPTSANQEQAPAPETAVGAPPKVPTGDMSVSAMAGLAAIGGVFALVAGLFAFSKRRKNKEMTRNIMTTSAKAWEHQNSTFEKMEEETSPIGSYTVIATYTPNLSDELDIQPGDKVTILVEFDDGWVQGINETRGGTKGVFPRHCVDMDRVTPSINNKRSSSIGGYTSEKYTEVDLN